MTFQTQIYIEIKLYQIHLRKNMLNKKQRQMKSQQFQPHQITYGTLAKFGLTQEMVEDLPRTVQEAILKGRRSPVLPIYITDEDGATIKARTRFALIVTEDSDVDVMFYPQLKKCEIDRFTPEEQKALLSNQAIIALATMPDGKKVPAFHQIDPGTNQIPYVPTPVIGRNLEIVAKTMKLTNAEMICLQKGMPVSTIDGDDMHTVGINLNENNGIGIVRGDVKQWREAQRDGIAKFNFGLNGCWTTDDEGNLDYVSEESYTEEIWEELRKKNNQRTIK